jgi:hypothetical protein
MDKSPGPFVFAASFPLDTRFAATLAELAARLALSTGCTEAVSQSIRDAVGAVVDQALADDGGSPGRTITLALETRDAAFATDVTSGDRSLLHVTHPRAA